MIFTSVVSYIDLNIHEKNIDIVRGKNHSGWG